MPILLIDVLPKKLNLTTSDNHAISPNKESSILKNCNKNLSASPRPKKNLEKDTDISTDPAHSRQRPQRTAVRKLQLDPVDEEDEGDFSASDIDDPTWKQKDSSSSDGECSSVPNSPDCAAKTPLRSLPNSPAGTPLRSLLNSPASTALRSLRNSPAHSVHTPLLNSPARSVHTPFLNSPAGSIHTPQPKKRTPKRAKVQQRKRLRNSGAEYTTAKNKVVHARSMKPLANCRSKCSEKITEENRKIVFAEYWGQRSFDRRVSYITGHVFEEKTKVQRRRSEDSNRNRTCTLRYELDVNNTRVQLCKKCFLATLGENDGFVKRALLNKKRSVSGVTEPDRRGRKPSSRKTPEKTIEAISKHIDMFPRYSSHYGRSHSSKMYLGVGVTKQSMYNDYCSKDNPKISFSVYVREFNKTGLKFKPPKIDTCQKCDALEMSLKHALPEKVLEIQAEQKLHHDKAKSAYDCKREDKAKQTITSWSASFDLQQVLYVPQISSGNVFYKRQLSVYNLTVFDCFNKRGINHMWNETDAGRGANEIASCLSHFIACDVPAEVKKLTLWSDTCSGQNKNSIVCAALISAVSEHPSLDVIDHKFLVPGHTHMECDQVHAVIERKKKSTAVELHHPSNMYNFIKTVEYKKEALTVVEMKNHFKDFASLLKLKCMGPLVARNKNQEGNPFAFAPVQWFRYQKKNPTVVLYKHSHDEETAFQELSFRRKGKIGSDALKPPQLNSTGKPISVAKKNDLLELLPQVNPLYHNFYENLMTSADQEDIDPDCLPDSDITAEIQGSLD
ncbi:Treslin [Frankliniella fusca]|uniref:Treslin n=1 Tax=Frankliniella fusca TaxID=407009 RepID=A0AAE1LIB9_9NEOP|nr:Treslin [Frankliniella fusca]